MNEILLAYVKHLEDHYCSPNGVSKEVVNNTLALRPVKQLYGESLAQNFGPLALKAVRQLMVDAQNLCRREVNKRFGRIKRVFKWAASEEHLNGSVFEALRTVDGLKIGRTTARESEPVKPVDDTSIDAPGRSWPPRQWHSCCNSQPTFPSRSSL